MDRLDDKIHNIFMGWPHSHGTNECCYLIEDYSGPHVVAATIQCGGKGFEVRENIFGHIFPNAQGF